MPAYNAGKYIAEAVSSVLEQTYTNWELIIVNDGSTDDTSIALKRFTDPRISVHQQENSGQCAAANKAFSLSKGRLIKFMDADDMISSGFIAEQVKRIGDSENAIASAAWGRFYNDDIRAFKLNEEFIRQDCKPIDWLVSSMHGKQAMMQCALWLIPRAVLEKSNLWDERLSLVNDFEFITRVLLQASEIRFAQNAVLYYRSGISNSLSALTSRRGIESAFTSIYEGTTYMLQHENSPRVRTAVADCLQNFVYAYYPYYPDIINKAQQRINELGGSKAKYPAGGYTKMLNRIIGWKLTQKFKALFG
ncbi:glycosyltransferase family A protein [Mucilaginibacter gossypii]|uniref:glycosyltransferase family 2 protein n=1 Tax=Mucilaginibacter gossypii TaxID=551996 RepID=UPI000DCE464A|nr:MULTISPECIES: glycosyltransferase family A protein [Mucilaginibacter]QTE36666.1 glycosyltransferase family A protein [Mucilaginibacter gossypii]RAV55507.1 glycosyltransferase family 2 protein [Mucilaginibacter rubeus]